MRFSIIIVNYNAGRRIKRCMAALAAQTFNDFEVLVVDNGSTDHSEKTPVPDARFRWILAKKNLGFAAGNNLAVREAKGEWIFLINPDAYAEPECLATLYAATLRHPSCMLFGCTQLDDKVPDILDGTGDCYLFAGFPWRGGKDWALDTLPDEGEVFGPCGAAYIVRRDVFLHAGGFDEDFFCYCEDVDLNFRLRLLGHHAVQVSEAFVRHEGSAISGFKSHFYVYHSTRNRIWTFVKNMPLAFLIPFIPLHLALNLLLLFSLKTFMARLDGLAAALEDLPKIWKKRAAIQASRTASLYALARIFAWNPFTFLWQKPVVRKINAK